MLREAQQNCQFYLPNKESAGGPVVNIFHFQSLSKAHVAEREGFEPSVGETYTRFPSVRLKPLGHLSHKFSEILTKMVQKTTFFQIEDVSTNPI